MAFIYDQENILPIIMGDPIPDFQNNLATRADVARVWMWYAQDRRSGTPKKSPVKSDITQEVLDLITTKLKTQWESSGKETIDDRNIEERVRRLLQKVYATKRFGTRKGEAMEKYIRDEKKYYHVLFDIEARSNSVNKSLLQVCTLNLLSF